MINNIINIIYYIKNFKMYMNTSKYNKESQDQILDVTNNIIYSLIKSIYSKYNCNYRDVIISRYNCINKRRYNILFVISKI